jgi:hypothetical protein
MKPYFLQIKKRGKLLYTLESAIPFQAFSIGDTLTIEEQHGVIKKIEHFLRDSTDDNETVHRIVLTIA